MKALILAATHERAFNGRGDEVIRPLLDLDGEPILTQMVRRLSRLAGVDRILIVTNDAIRPELEEWTHSLPSALAPVTLISDGTRTREHQLGAVGDILFALDTEQIEDDLVIVGGDNWFTYDLDVLIREGRLHSPAVIVTPAPAGSRLSRFGIAEVAADGRIAAFVEKPDSTFGGHKAACVYFFNRQNLEYFRIFASEANTRCSPGTFLAWLVNKGVRLQGVRVSAGWCDVGEHKQLTGPSLLRFRQIVREIVHPKYSTWERAAGQRLQWVSSHRDLLDVLEKTEREPDPNLRIVACNVLGRLSEFVDEIARKEIEQNLKAVLADRSSNDISGGVMQSDEDSATYVSLVAAASLAHLGYAPDTEGVFTRAENEGYRVCRH